MSFLAAAEAPRSSLREMILNARQPASRFEGFVERLCPLFDLGPGRMRSLLKAIASAHGAPWEQSPFEGGQLPHFNGGPHVEDADCGLVRVEAGAPMPSHRHLGDEWIFMLQGRMRDDRGRVSAPGDLIHSAPGTVHDYAVVGTETVVFAVVPREDIEWLVD